MPDGSFPSLARPTWLGQNDVDDFRVFYRRHAGLVFGVARRLGVPERSVEDVVQEVFVVAYRRREDFDPDASTAAWLVGITRKVVSRHWRGESRRNRKHEALANQVVADDLACPTKHLIAQQFMERFLPTLEPERRDVFVLADVEGHTGPEIAAQLGINVDTAYSRLRSARKAMKRQLVEESRDEKPTRDELRACWVSIAPVVTQLEASAAAVGSTSLFGWAANAVAQSSVAAFGTTFGAGLLVVLTARLAVPTAEPGPAPSASASLAAPPLASASMVPLAAAPTVLAAHAPEPGASEAPLDAEPQPPRGQVRSTASTAPAPPSTLAEETAILQWARGEVRDGRPEAALELARSHAERFPDGDLRVARLRVQLRAECSLGQSSRATKTAAELSRADALFDERTDPCGRS